MEIDKNTKEFIDRTLKKQKEASEKARLEYEKTNDPKIIIKFIREDFSGETIKEPWIANILAEWHREQRKDLLSKLFFPKGHPETPYQKKLQNLLFVDRIDRYKGEHDGSLSTAIITEMERLAGGTLAKVDENVFQKLKNQYERYKKIPTICRVIEGPEHYEIILYATKITLGLKQNIARATARYKFPKK